MSQLIILTGGRGVGKTTVCHRVVALARRRGYECRGILTVARQGVRDVLNVHSGGRRRLTTASGEERVVTQGRFQFDPQTLSWGNEILSQARPCHLLVIDEIGPLEMERGQGWVSAFDVLQAGQYALALLVVRPELIVPVCDKLHRSDLDILTVTRENRDRLPMNLVETVGEAS